MSLPRVQRPDPDTIERINHWLMEGGEDPQELRQAKHENACDRMYRTLADLSLEIGFLAVDIRDATPDELAEIKRTLDSRKAIYDFALHDTLSDYLWDETHK